MLFLAVQLQVHRAARSQSALGFPAVLLLLCLGNEGIFNLVISGAVAEWHWNDLELEVMALIISLKQNTISLDS